MHDVGQRFALEHVGQRQGKALAFADDIGGGIGVEMAGATLGLAAVNLDGVQERLSMVGDEHQVDGQGLAALA